MRKDIGGKIFNDNKKEFVDDLERHRKFVKETKGVKEVYFTYEERPVEKPKELKINFRYGIMVK